MFGSKLGHDLTEDSMYDTFFPEALPRVWAEIAKALKAPDTILGKRIRKTAGAS